MVDPAPQPLPRYLYVAACYDRHEATAYHLLVTSVEEHDPETDAGIAAISRLLAKASDAAYRAEVRVKGARIGNELRSVVRYWMTAMAAGTGAWAPESTDPDI